MGMAKMVVVELKSQYESIRQEIMPAIDAVFAENYFILGEHAPRVTSEFFNK
ncbi:MAG: hypothetical protein HYR55_20490 [Acidobacteria bacterium]|nr:hypothetical protein [Acidobacteriota bacterium]MBI3655629.1 hypothetical protein [Acidobacteriota bacterium]